VTWLTPLSICTHYNAAAVNRQKEPANGFVLRIQHDFMHKSENIAAEKAAP
jgi:hypothetical protein